MKLSTRSLLLAAAVTLPMQAATITEPTRVFFENTVIPDFQDPPLVFTETVSDSFIYFITDMQVSLHLVGVDEGSGFASEMFVSLNKDLTATTVLINQVGVTTADPVGAYYDGWDATFSDGAPNGDIHDATLPSGVLTGLWQPDGRTDATSSSRPLLLDAFDNFSGNGAWRLAVGDLQLGGQMRLVSWSLTLTGETEDDPDRHPELYQFDCLPVPEAGPMTACVLFAGLAAGAVLLKRRKTFQV